VDNSRIALKGLRKNDQGDIVEYDLSIKLNEITVISMVRDEAYVSIFNGRCYRVSHSFDELKRLIENTETSQL
jgi:hypothetical protein